MMRLLRSWRDSLLLLAPQNFKLFALVTLKSTFETYKVLARIWVFWVLPFILARLLVIVTYDHGRGLFPTEFFLGLFVIALTMTICLATRPSIRQKSSDYFRSKASLVFLLLSFFMFVLIVRTLDQQFPYTIFALDFVPLWIFFILFLLDSDCSFKQFWVAVARALTMFVYNLPLLLLLMVAMLAPGIIFVNIIVSHQWPKYLALLLYMYLFQPFLINIWTNIYIKKLHEMPDLYFKQPK